MAVRHVDLHGVEADVHGVVGRCRFETEDVERQSEQIWELGGDEIVGEMAPRSVLLGDDSGCEVSGEHGFFPKTDYFEPFGTKTGIAPMLRPVKEYRTDRDGTLSQTPPKRRPGRPKTVDRHRAVDVAMDNYWREGLHAVSLSELCRRASLSKPALYREFVNEDGLMEAALEHYRQLVIVPLLSFITTEQPLGSMLDLIVEGMTSERDAPAGCLFTQMRLETHRLGPQTAARIRTIEEERLDAFEAWYRRAVESGGADPNLSPAFAARYLDTQLGAVLLQMGAGAPPGQVRAQAKLALSVLLR